MNNQQLINQIENKITETQNNIQCWETELKQHKSTLTALIEELNQIKNQIQKNNMKNIKESPKGSNNNQ